MRKISDLNYSQHITLADNFKQKNKALDTWYVGMNDFSRIAGGQNSRSNILSPGAFLEFLAKIFTLGYVDFSKRSNEAGRKMMTHIESSSYSKDTDGNEKMKFYMNNPEGERADLSKVKIELHLPQLLLKGFVKDIQSLYLNNLMVRLIVMKGSLLKEKMIVHYT